MDTRGQKEQKYGHKRTQRAPWRLIHTRIWTIPPPLTPTSANKPHAKQGLNRKARLTLRPIEHPLAARAETIFGHKCHQALAAAANIKPRLGRPAKRMIGERSTHGFHSQSLSHKRPEKATKRPRVAFLIWGDREISTKLGAPHFPICLEGSRRCQCSLCNFD